MSYAALLQFCVDFQLSPRIASANFIKHVYETTRSLAHRQASLMMTIDACGPLFFHFATFPPRATRLCLGCVSLSCLGVAPMSSRM